MEIFFKKKIFLIVLIFNYGLGYSQSDWVNYYIETLKESFNIQYYDCCDLGQIDKTEFNERNIHTQFVSGGINIAANNLAALETKEVNILAFSIGGTIAWKASLKGLKIDKLYAVSSTRLRLETIKPNCDLRLIYGEYDQNKPENNWFEKMKVKNQIIRQQGHSLYMNKIFATELTKRIILDLTKSS